MQYILLVVIYLTFISLGLPDALLGSSWPVMREDLGVPLEMAGWLMIVIISGTVISGLFSGELQKRFGAGPVTLISVLLTALALFGYSMVPSAIWLFVLAVPLGMGGGAVDAMLNSYVASHYRAHHMNWLHSSWGVGATAGPAIMAAYLAQDSSWRGGYGAVAMIQFGLVIILFISLPLWRIAAAQTAAERKVSSIYDVEAPAAKSVASRMAVRFKSARVITAMTAFFVYVGAEFTVGLWAGSYLVDRSGFSAEEAAGAVAAYYMSITAGRLLSGWISLRMNHPSLIRLGLIIAVAGVMILLFPLSPIWKLFSLMMIGLGFAPLYPSMMHRTPEQFGTEEAPHVIGYQTSAGAAGIICIPPLFGWIAAGAGMEWLPLFLAVCMVLLIAAVEKNNR